MCQSKKPTAPDAEVVTRLVESLEAMAASLKSIDARLEKWERGGLPPSYELMSAALHPQVVDFTRTS